MNKLLLLSAAAALPLMMPTTAAVAGPAVMVQAKECTIIDGGPGFGTCTETHDQTGLAIKYIDEMTDLHPYVSIPPLHNFIFFGNEWFSNEGTTSASVSYWVDAIKPIRIDHFVLWNEESSGIGEFNLWYGLFPGDKLDLVLAGISPPDNPLADYAPTYWEFAPRPGTGWWTLEMSGCPQPVPGSFAACAVGEVAWGGPAVPEPGTWAMLIAGFGLVGWAARNRRRDFANA